MTITWMLQSKVQMQVCGSGGLCPGEMGTSSMRWDIEGVGSSGSGRILIDMLQFPGWIVPWLHLSEGGALCSCLA